MVYQNLVINACFCCGDASSGLKTFKGLGDWGFVRVTENIISATEPGGRVGIIVNFKIINITQIGYNANYFGNARIPYPAPGYNNYRRYGLVFI